MTPSIPPLDDFDFSPQWTPDVAEGSGVAVLPAPEAESEREPSDEGETRDARESVVCDCLQVRLGALQDCVARGCATVEALARETGATTVCGGCLPRVAALVQTREVDGPVRLVDVREVLPDVRSFRFAPADPERTRLGTHLPGQHVILSARVDGRWISRPYTVTSVPGNGSVCEITVKRDPLGRFSDALFGRRFDPDSLRLTAPRGDFNVDLAAMEPVIFLVGGIGVTPALAVARAIAACHGSKRVHIDYSARDRSDHAFAADLRRLTDRRANITVNFRKTDHGEGLRVADAKGYRRDFPAARFYICGPTGYQEMARRHLRRAGVRPERIHIESFEKGRPASDRLPWRARDRAMLLVGLLLLLAYVVQGVAGLEWPRLAALQDTESYRRWSGGALMGFLAVQWVLPVLRLRGAHQAAARVYPWHRALGVLAPAIFYAHATRLGYGYLLALSLVYLANVGVGLADKTVVRDPAWRERYARMWLVPHVALALLTVGLALFHVFVVFAYE